MYLYDIIQERAAKTRRSFNAEVLIALEDYFGFNILPFPLRVKEAAEYLAITEKQLLNLVEKGEIAYYKPSPKIMVFKHEDLDEYLSRIEMSAFTASPLRKPKEPD